VRSSLSLSERLAVKLAVRLVFSGDLEWWSAWGLSQRHWFQSWLVQSSIGKPWLIRRPALPWIGGVAMSGRRAAQWVMARDTGAARRAVDDGAWRVRAVVIVDTTTAMASLMIWVALEGGRVSTGPPMCCSIVESMRVSWVETSSILRRVIQRMLVSISSRIRPEGVEGWSSLVRSCDFVWSSMMAAALVVCS